MKKRTLIILSVLAVALLGISFISKKNSSKVREEKTISYIEKSSTQVNESIDQQRMTVSSTDDGNIKSSATKSRLTKITTTELQSLKKALPSKEQIEKDRELNPHTPSITLMNFAKELSPLMEKAIVNESDADHLIGELNSCALDDSIHKAARALCVQDTEKLANYHPQMKSKASELRASVSLEVQKILDTNDSFILK